MIREDCVTVDSGYRVMAIHLPSRPLRLPDVSALLDLLGSVESECNADVVAFYICGDPSARLPSGCVDPRVGLDCPADGMSAFSRLERALLIVERLARPTMVVLEGRVGPVGIELALAADLTIAVKGTRLSVGVTEGGLLPGMCLYRLVRQIGAGATRRIVFGGSALDARQAYRLGIVDRIVPAAHPSLQRELSHLMSLPASSVSLVRKVLHEGASAGYQRAYEVHKAAQYQALVGADNAKVVPKP